MPSNTYPQNQEELLKGMFDRGLKDSGSRHVRLSVKQTAWLIGWTHNEEQEATYKNFAAESFRGPSEFTWEWFSIFYIEKTPYRVTLHRYPNHAGFLTFAQLTSTGDAENRIREEAQGRLESLKRAVTVSRNLINSDKWAGLVVDEQWRADFLKETENYEAEALKLEAQLNG